MKYNKHDIVLVKGTALDVGTFEHQPWSATIGGKEQITEPWLWLNKNEPSKREIKEDEEIIYIIPISNITKDCYEATDRNITITFTDDDILGLAPLPRLLDENATIEQVKPQTQKSAKQTSETKTTKITSVKPNIEFKGSYPQYPMIGSDETGCGSYFGGEVAAAVYIKDQEDVDFLIELGVADSKTISDTKIRKIAPNIIDHMIYAYSEVLPEQYNHQIDRGFNGNKVKAYLHNHALTQLEQKLKALKSQPVDNIIIDEFASEKAYFDYLYGQHIPFKKKTRFETKSESKYIAVAAASIVARYIYLKQLDMINDSLKDTFGKNLPQGVGQKVKETLKALIEKNIEIRYYSKVHFKTTKEVQNEIVKERISKNS